MTNAITHHQHKQARCRMKRSTPTVRRNAALLISLSLAVTLPAYSDDTEALFGGAGFTSNAPNIVFIIDTSGSMNWNVNCTSGCSNLPNTNPNQRLRVVKSVFADIMNGASGINVAVMRFDSATTAADNQGGYFITPMQALDATSRPNIISAVNSLNAEGWTPLSETLYEAAQFYRGGAVRFGNSTSPGTNVPGVLNPTNTSRYLSPISSQCLQNNYIVYLTDGDPTNDTDAESDITSLPCFATATGSSSGSNNCLDELAAYLNNRDFNDTLGGTQNVVTYTIGFLSNQSLLQNAATRGGGQYYTANNASELSAAFTSILNDISERNISFTPPSLAVNVFNNVAHHNKLFFNLFRPSSQPKWDGNIKAYTLSGTPPRITDADNLAAVDANGYFLSTSRSLWSSADDGSNISAGGANANLPTAASRSIYTYTGDYTDVTPDASLSALALSNADLTAGLLGVADDTARTNVINWARGSILGDPLHSAPALVTYGGTSTNPDMTLFVGTNAGFLHAINATNGVERFAFVPKELLGNLRMLSGTTGSHPYGLDGSVTTWVHDADRDGNPTEVGEHVYVYAGMRRGGRNYYALDVTNLTAPSLKWVIRGGEGDFAELGQSWSKPTVAKIRLSNADRQVLIFGGGYDTAQDSATTPGGDTVGRAIFIVDAESGARLWWAGPAGSGANLELATLTNSIPSDIRVLDMNLDGYADRLYVGDMRGQIFRIDLTHGETATAISAQGVRLAALGGTDAASHRRFYYAPDVVLAQRPSSGRRHLAINIGSGFREGPLSSTVADRFYSIKDSNVYNLPPADFTTITEAALYNASSNLVAQGDAADREAELNTLHSRSGWYIELSASGEKVLAEAMTIDGEIYFTSYVPPSAAALANICAGAAGSGRFYQVNLFDARPLIDRNVNGTLEPTDRYEQLNRPGIPPSPAAIFKQNDDGTIDVVICKGTECEQRDNTINVTGTDWIQTN